MRKKVGMERERERERGEWGWREKERESVCWEACVVLFFHLHDLRCRLRCRAADWRVGMAAIRRSERMEMRERWMERAGWKEVRSCCLERW